MRNKAMKSCITWIMTLVFVAGFAAQGHATPDGRVSTEQLLQELQLQEHRSTVSGFLERDAVKAQLAARGVSAADAQTRVDAMSAAELSALSAQIDELPAGEGILETVLFLVVIFMLLDIAGVTDIFPGI